MLPYGGKRKEYTYIHTHTHPTLPQAVSVFHFTIKCLKYYALYVTILPPFIPLCYCKLNFYLSVCDSDHFTVTSLRENNALPPANVFSLFLLIQFVLSAGKHGRWLFLPWASPASSLPNSLSPHFPSCNCPDTQREFFIILCM